jgi:hypothetical protein
MYVRPISTRLFLGKSTPAIRANLYPSRGSLSVIGLGYSETAARYRIRVVPFRIGDSGLRIQIILAFACVSYFRKAL